MELFLGHPVVLTLRLTDLGCQLSEALLINFPLLLFSCMRFCIQIPLCKICRIRIADLKFKAIKAYRKREEKHERVFDVKIIR